MKKKLLTILVVLSVFSLPILAVVIGHSLTNILKDLSMQLHTAYIQREEAQQRFNEDYDRQHQRMLDVITKSNELSILLYTQDQDMTFDLAYALKKASDEHKDFGMDRKPYDQIVNSLDIEIDRYARLIAALRRLPPMIREAKVGMLPDSLLCSNDSLNLHLSSSVSALENEVIRIAAKDTLASPFVLDVEGRMYRDSCIFYASELMKMHAENRAKLMADSTHYQEAFWRVQEAYDYAELCYKDLERYVFVEGQTPFWEILGNFKYYWNKTLVDLEEQYDIEDLENSDISSEKSATKNAKEIHNNSALNNLSSKGEKFLLVVFCCIQLVLLAFFWLVTLLILWLIHRFVKLKHFIPKKKLSLFSVLVGTFLYFLVFGFFWKGDEYAQMGVKHINTFLWLLIAISGSLLLRVKPEQIRHGIQLYSPTFLMVLVIIVCRITFIPDKMLVLLFPPILFLVVLRQLFFCLKVAGKATSIDITLGWVSLAIYFIAFVFAFFGYTFVSLLVLVWWYFQLAVLLTIVCVSDLLGRYKERWLNKRVDAARERITYVSGEDRESLLFGVTWLHDLVKQVLIPAMLILSLPLCIRMSLGIFDFDDLFVKLYEYPFIQLFDKEGFETLLVSGKSIVYLLILFYVLRYFSRAVHAVWRYIRYTTFMRKHNRTTIRINEINLSLGNSIISALVWMSYAAIVIYVWKIPTGSLGLVAGGLSAGIGLALKDTINNFIYGIQLMGGRLRVGDWIECDGIRGRVTSINYQCVQAETIEGTEMSFLNASLFGKNFNNLTRNHSYELTTINVGVAYGTDVKRVRDVLVEAMLQVRTKDQYGREIVDPDYGISVVVGNMSDSAVVITVKQFVLVAERIGYVDRAKEVIYDALAAAGITIAFPQCDVHLIQAKPNEETV